jgi:hypothetical protein
MVLSRCGSIALFRARTSFGAATDAMMPGNYQLCFSTKGKQTSQ